MLTLELIDVKIVNPVLSSDKSDARSIEVFEGVSNSLTEEEEAIAAKNRKMIQRQLYPAFYLNNLSWMEHCLRRALIMERSKAEKYRKMLNMCILKDAVRHSMLRDQVSAK